MKFNYLPFLLIGVIVFISGCSSQEVPLLIQSSSNNTITINNTIYHNTTINQTINNSIEYNYINNFNQVLNTTSNVTFNSIIGYNNISQDYLNDSLSWLAITDQRYNDTSLIKAVNSSKSGIGSCSANQFQTGDTVSDVVCAQPSFGNLSGTITDAQMTNQKLNLTDQRYNDTTLANTMCPKAGCTYAGTITTRSITIQATYILTIGNTTAGTCGSAQFGQVIANWTTKKLMWCNTTAWVSFG